MAYNATAFLRTVELAWCDQNAVLAGLFLRALVESALSVLLPSSTGSVPTKEQVLAQDYHLVVVWFNTIIFSIPTERTYSVKGVGCPYTLDYSLVLQRT
jgi:hypothetical protein